jgi:hypothetical protein
VGHPTASMLRNMSRQSATAADCDIHDNYTMIQAFFAQLHAIRSSDDVNMSCDTDFKLRSLKKYIETDHQNDVRIINSTLILLYANYCYSSCVSFLLWFFGYIVYIAGK